MLTSTTDFDEDVSRSASTVYTAAFRYRLGDNNGKKTVQIPSYVGR